MHRPSEDYTEPFVRSTGRDLRSCSVFGTGRPGKGLRLRELLGFGANIAPGVPFLNVTVGVTGASGSIYAFRLLERLRLQPGLEIHLVLSRAAEKTLFLETGKRSADLRAFANHFYPQEDIAAPIASGSFRTHGMVIAPCSIHTMSAIAHGITDNLIVRAADVVLKERRRLILMIRESPFHTGHLRTMTALSEMGAIIAPPVPGFYNNPKTIEDLVDSSVDRVLDLLDLPDDRIKRWPGPKGSL